MSRRIELTEEQKKLLREFSNKGLRERATKLFVKATEDGDTESLESMYKFLNVFCLGRYRLKDLSETLETYFSLPDGKKRDPLSGVILDALHKVIKGDDFLAPLPYIIVEACERYFIDQAGLKIVRDEVEIGAVEDHSEVGDASNFTPTPPAEAPLPPSMNFSKYKLMEKVPVICDGDLDRNLISRKALEFIGPDPEEMAEIQCLAGELQKLAQKSNFRESVATGLILSSAVEEEGEALSYLRTEVGTDGEDHLQEVPIIPACFDLEKFLESCPPLKEAVRKESILREHLEVEKRALLESCLGPKACLGKGVIESQYKRRLDVYVQACLDLIFLCVNNKVTFSDDKSHLVDENQKPESADKSPRIYRSPQQMQEIKKQAEKLEPLIHSSRDNDLSAQGLDLEKAYGHDNREKMKGASSAIGFCWEQQKKVFGEKVFYVMFDTLAFVGLGSGILFFVGKMAGWW